MSAIKFNGNKWAVDFGFNGKRIRKVSPENSRAGALAYEAAIRQRMARGDSPDQIFDEKPQERQPTFRTFAWKWYKIHAVPNNKPSELQRKRYCLQANLVPFFGRLPLDEITPYRVEQFKAKETGAGLHPKTINNHLTVLSSCLNSAVAWGVLDSIPKIKKLKVPPPKVDFLTKDECTLLLANSKGVWHDVIFTALKTGLRLGELKGLEWPDINWTTRTLHVRRAYCAHSKTLTSPKSNKERVIPLVDELQSLLLQKRKQSGAVFTDDRGERFNVKRLEREIGRACKRAGMRVVTCHKLRHTFASHLAMAGAPLGAIQMLLGHSDIKTTMLYAHLSPSSLRDTVTLLNARRSPVVRYDSIASVDASTSSLVQDAT